MSSIEPIRPVPTAARSAAPAGPPPTRFQRFLSYRLLLGLAAAIVALDQLTKAWIAAHLALGTYGEPGAIVVIPGFFHLVHVGNTGAAWSMFSGQSHLLAALKLATLVAIFYWRRALGLQARFTQVCFGLLCGGILGNLIDRVAHGYVVDFLDFHFGSYIYPTFNIADSGICVGVILYVWHSLREPKS